MRIMEMRLNMVHDRLILTFFKSIVNLFRRQILLKRLMHKRIAILSLLIQQSRPSLNEIHKPIGFRFRLMGLALA